MRKIKCTFYRPEKVNIREFENIIGKLTDDFNTICTEETLDTESVLRYVYHLLLEAKPLENNSGMYFLGLDDPRSMPSDARVDFFYMPTYISTAIIIKAVLCYKERIEDWLETGWEYEEEYRERMETVFPGLLKGCTGRGFTGHGYDSLQGLIETLQIFAKAGAAEFIEKYPDICPEFSEKYRKAVIHVEELVKDGKVRNSWGEDYTKEAEEMLQTMNKKK